MANQENQERRGAPKEVPTLVTSYIREILGISVWDASITKERLEAKVMEAINTNPEIASYFKVVSYTMSPKAKEQIAFIDKQISDVKSRQEKREQKHNEWYEKNYNRYDKKGNLLPPTEKAKQEEEKWQDKLAAGKKSDENSLSKLTKAKYDITYPEKIKEREAAHQNEKNQEKAEKLIDTIAEAEEKKEKQKKKKIAFVGEAIGETIEGVGKGFQQGRHLRGY